MQPDTILCLAMFGLGSWELLIILLVALLLFGRRLPELMRGLGSSAREFKKGMSEEAVAAPPPAAKPPTT
jgi:sec-independent protein translocase protein TatA